MFRNERNRQARQCARPFLRVHHFPSAARRAPLEPRGLPHRGPPPLGYFAETFRDVSSAARAGALNRSRARRKLRHRRDARGARVASTKFPSRGVLRGSGRCPRPLRDPTKTENLRDLAARYPARSVALRRVRREAAAHQRRRADRRARACEVSSRSDFRSSELHPPKRANRAGNLHGVRRMQGPVFDVPASRRGDASPDRSNPER